MSLLCIAGAAERVGTAEADGNEAVGVLEAAASKRDGD
jgi:hypothetical protein